MGKGSAKKATDIEVFLRLGQSPHGAYQDLLKFPPAGIHYTTDAPTGKPTPNRRLSHTLKLSVWNVLSKATIPVAVVNAGGAQVVHSTNNFVPITKKPWFVDSEHVWGLLGFRWGRIASPYYKWQLKSALSADNCKGVLAWSDAASHTIRITVGKKLAGKVRTIRPAIGPRPTVKRRARDTPAFLFVGKRFVEKGGIDLLQAYEKVRKKTDAELTIVSDVPMKYREKYERFGDIRFVEPRLSHEVLSREFYSKSHALVFPTYIDTFGMVVLEAMAHGLPVVSTDCLAIPELCIDGRNGFAVKRPFPVHDKDGFFLEDRFPKWPDLLGKIERERDEKFIAGLSERMLLLAEDAPQWGRMSKNCVADSQRGRLSVANRNALLGNTYGEAIA